MLLLAKPPNDHEKHLRRSHIVDFIAPRKRKNLIKTQPNPVQVHSVELTPQRMTYRLS